MPKASRFLAPAAVVIVTCLNAHWVTVKGGLVIVLVHVPELTVSRG